MNRMENKTLKRPMCLICLAFVLALYCYMEWKPRPPYVLETYDGRYVEITGQIYQKEIKQEQFVLYLNQVTFCDGQSQMKQEQSHKVMCYCREAEPDIQIGSYVQAKGKIQSFSEATNPGEFDMRKYYHILGIDVQMKDVVLEKKSAYYSRRKEALWKLRCKFSEIYDTYLSERDAGMMKAMVLGEKQQLDKESKNLYQKAGIAHILAISGLHISMLGMFLFWLLQKMRIPLPVCIGISIFLMIQYGDMTGMSNSAYRAIFMFSIQILAKSARRTYDMLTAMMISCMSILLENPQYIYHSGFQLSFGAILGIGLMNPVLCDSHYQSKEEIGRNCNSRIMTEVVYYIRRIKQSLQGSVAVSAVHLPILLTQYYSFPVYSFFINLLVIPLLTVLLGAGILLLLLSETGFVFRIIPTCFIHCILDLYEWLAKMTVDCLMGNWITGCPTAFQVIAYLMILGILLLYHEKMSMWIRYMFLLAGVMVLTVSFRSGMQITVLDVGQGDGICIETQEGHCYLIDGGSVSKKDVGTYQIIPFLKYRGIDRIKGIFLTHLDEDHISGVKELLAKQRMEGIRIENIILSKAVIRDEAYRDVLALCREYEVTVRMMAAGDEIRDGKLQIQCIFPDDKYVAEDRNAASLALCISCGGFKGLFAGDVDEQGESVIAKELQSQEQGSYQVFKATHHGSRYSNTQQLLEQLQPQLTFISCGKHNQYGHPHAETLERFMDIETRVLRTDENGAIIFRITEKRCSVECFGKN